MRHERPGDDGHRRVERERRGRTDQRPGPASDRLGGALLVLDGWGIGLAILFALLAALACGAFNGTLVARFGVQPIIATLILFIAGRGIAQLITGGQLQPLSNHGFQWIGIAQPLGVPAQVFVALLVAVAVAAVMRLTIFGRYVA